MRSPIKIFAIVAGILAASACQFDDSEIDTIEQALSSYRVRVELKAWIPHSDVEDPWEEVDRAAHLAAGHWDYSSRYRGDNHTGYDGGHRLLGSVEFDWDGSQISNFSSAGNYGTTHRDYKYKYWGWCYNWLLRANIPCHRWSYNTESKTATSSISRSNDSTTSFTIDMSSANPIAAGSPTIDSDVTGTFTDSNTISLDWKTDQFPSHGIRITIGGVEVYTDIIKDASGVDGNSTIDIGWGLTHEQWAVYNVNLPMTFPGTCCLDSLTGNNYSVGEIYYQGTCLIECRSGCNNYTISCSGE